MSQMTTTSLTVNGQRQSATAHPDTPLLWVLRELPMLPVRVKQALLESRTRIA